MDDFENKSGSVPNPCADLMFQVSSCQQFQSRVSNMTHSTSPSTSLTDALASSLPAALKLRYYHISSPPTPCDPIYAAPPGHKPERTYSESHSLLVTTTTTTAQDGKQDEVAIYAIEIVLYTTAHLSTLFVSKADSTGYASLLQTESGAGSMIKIITSGFIRWLVEHRHRPERRLVLSLFARAQNQYLFPGSVDNDKKHVLDDRQLVKWWCKTLDPIVRACEPDTTASSPGAIDTTSLYTKAHLIVPGHDTHETSAFLPPSSRLDPANAKRWTNSHPLETITQHPTAPPRCLIPHFPDDPKARFLSELDEEIPDAVLSQSSQSFSQNSSATLTSPKKRGTGMWKSVKTLDQFWEMMAYRQECCSGRLVGFIWVVFTPGNLLVNATKDLHDNPVASPTPRKNIVNADIPDFSLRTTKRKSPTPGTAPPTKKRKLKHTHILTGLIRPRAPHSKSPTTLSSSSFTSTTSFSQTTQPETSPYYHAPHTTRGTTVLPLKEYDRVHEILLRQDFSSLADSCKSTKTWIQQTGIVAGMGGRAWGVDVVGRGTTASMTKSLGSDDNAGLNVNVLSVKSRDGPGVGVPTGNQAQTLPAMLVRKKPKPDETVVTQQPEVNVLHTGLVRKKAKA